MKIWGSKSPETTDAVGVQPTASKVGICFGGPEGDRTLDLTDANRTLSQTELRAQSNSSENGTAEKQYEIIGVAENRTLCAPN